MQFPSNTTLYAVVTVGSEDDRVMFHDEPAVFTDIENAEVHMKFDTKRPVVIYEMRPIWRSEREMKYTKIDRN